MEDNTYCLDSDLLLGPGQQKDIMVVLDKKWGEDTLVSRHQDFDEPEVEVFGEVGEGGATSLGTLVAHSHVSFLLLHFSTSTTKKLISSTAAASLDPSKKFRFTKFSTGQLSSCIRQKQAADSATAVGVLTECPGRIHR